MKYGYLFLFVVILLSSCMSRTNPLDPHTNSNIIVPETVNNFQATALSSTVVKLTWQKNSAADGYYIYRSMSMDGKFIRVDNDMLYSGNITQFLDENDAFVSETFYWYKISAYKVYGEKKLEGYRSNPIYVYIP